MRTTPSVPRHKRRKRLLKSAKGFNGARKNLASMLSWRTQHNEIKSIKTQLCTLWHRNMSNIAFRVF